MAISKVNYGNKVLLDLTGDTIKKEKLLSGFTAHDASGEQITGTMAIQESNYFQNGNAVKLILLAIEFSIIPHCIDVSKLILVKMTGLQM